MFIVRGNIIEYVRCFRPPSKGFEYIDSLNDHNEPMKEETTVETTVKQLFNNGSSQVRLHK